MKTALEILGVLALIGFSFITLFILFIKYSMWLAKTVGI
jgi:hypothetical protein